jgi:aminoglycoside N3'-acetyltransferase
MMVHASLRAIGPVDGGASGVIEAVRAALGPDGTMLMIIAANAGEAFDRLSTPADPDIGVLALRVARFAITGTNRRGPRSPIHSGRWPSHGST